MVRQNKYLFLVVISGLIASACLPSGDDIPLSPTTEKPTSSPLIDNQQQVEITIPKPNTRITSPLTIQGEVPGNWYLDRVVIARLITESGTVIALASLPAKADINTSSSVPFDGQIEFETPQEKTGMLIIEQPSGEMSTEEIESIRIPVQF